MHISRHALTLLALIPAILADAAPLAGVSPALQSPEGKPVLPQKPSNSEDSPSYIIEQYSTSFRFENDGTSRRELRVRARVLSDEGAKELSRLVFDYDRQTEQLEISDVEIHQGRRATWNQCGEVRRVDGHDEVTPDHQAILGPVKEVEGFWCACGFSGHGFMQAPAVGEQLAQTPIASTARARTAQKRSLRVERMSPSTAS